MIDTGEGTLESQHLCDDNTFSSL